METHFKPILERVFCKQYSLPIEWEIGEINASSNFDSKNYSKNLYKVHQ